MEPSVFVLRARRPGLASTSLAGLLVGLTLPMWAFVAEVDPGMQVTAVVIGGVICAGAVVGVVGGLIGRERLVVDQDGIALERGSRVRFRVAWDEMAAVAMTVSVVAGPPTTTSGRPSAVVPSTASTSVDLVPADAAALERHPEMRSFRRAGGGRLWRVRLGLPPAEQEAVGRAVQARRPRLWRGVVGSPGGRIGR